MMTYSQPLSNYNYSHYPYGTSRPKGKKSQPAPEPKYFASPSSATSHGPFSGANLTANPRTLPPYISVQRASEPASPATIATTVSSSHSTPSPSPSRLPNISTSASHDGDFTLFDDAIVAVDQDINAGAGKGRVGLDVPSTMSDGPQNLGAYPSAGFPIIVPHDAPYPNYTQSGIYHSYASGGLPSSDSSADLYNFNNDQRLPQNQLQQLTPKKLLHPNSRNSGTSASNSTSRGSVHEVEPIDNVPALSPTSRQRAGFSPRRNNNRPNSPLSPNYKVQSQNTNYPSASTSSNYLHSAMPKLGRTFSDAAQDELYNPDFSRQASVNSSQFAESNKRSPPSRGNPTRAIGANRESRNSVPHMFQEAQQQHEHDLYGGSAREQPARDQSPFRQNSPFHPTNNVTYPASYGDSNRDIAQGHVHQDISQNQLAMALAIHEQIQKGARQTSAPKTISPRDSLLEYHEPENSQNQLNLFPTTQSNRVPTGQQEVTGTGSLHGSQDGSDIDDFQSMATSRRGSIANSSVSSHLEVPRFNMIQSSFESSPTGTYYYTDPTTIGGALPLMEPPYINPIPRPVETAANTGTYTCTYSGCGHRFTTSTKLQKHRRESHRKATPSGNSVSSAAAIACRNAQPGPHRCMRVNPSTGKPCNTVFSRPYDLTRHEDTIHNSAKAKVRCEICNDDKTFSRGDALVRHRRVKHNIS